MADPEKVKKIVTVDFNNEIYSDIQREMAGLLLATLEEVQKDNLEGLSVVGFATNRAVVRQMILKPNADSFKMLGVIAYGAIAMGVQMWSSEHAFHEEDEDSKPIRH